MLITIIELLSRQTADEYIHNPFILLGEKVDYVPHQHSGFHHPYLEGVRLLTNAEVIISRPEAIQGNIPKGKVTSSYLESLVVDNAPFRIYPMQIRNLQNFINRYLLRTRCRAGEAMNIPQAHGLLISYETDTCLVDNLLLCTWFVSSSDRCRRWSAVRMNEIVYVAVLSSIIDDYSQYFDGVEYVEKGTLRDGAHRFTEQYFSTEFECFTGSDVVIRANYHGFFRVLLLLMIIFCIGFNIRQCYIQSENSQDMELNDIHLDDDSELLFFPTMTRKMIIENLASEKDAPRKREGAGYKSDRQCHTSK